MQNRILFTAMCCYSLYSMAYSSVLVIDAVKFTRPYEYDVLLNDIHESDLHLIAQMDGVAYLNTSSDTTPLFPVEGVIIGGHKRLMVNLLVRLRKTYHHYRNIVFMVDTGSPYTFLSHIALEALIGSDSRNIPAAVRLEIHGTQSMVCYMSPRDKHFADINLLGTDFLEMKGIQMQMDWKQKTFQLYANEEL